MHRALGLISATFAAALAIALFSAPAFGQVYKCVDNAGKTVYSQSPCPTGSKSAPIRSAVPNVPPPPAAAPAASADGSAAPAAGAGSNAAAAGKAAASSGPKTAAEQEIDFRKRRVAEAEAAKKASDKAAADQSKVDNCNSAKTNLASLQSGGRQARVSPTGERYFLSDDQIASETERARQAVATNCSAS